MLIAEQVLLLARDLRGEATNSALEHKDIERWLTIALLVELAAMGRLRFSEGKVSATDQMPAHHSLLTDALRAIHKAQPLKVSAAVSLLRSQLGSLQSSLLDFLVTRGILLKQTKRRFGIFPSTRYAIQSTRTRDECTQALKDAVDGMHTDDVKALGLYLICDGMGLVDAILGTESASRGAAKIAEVEAQLSGNKQATDPGLARSRLIMVLTNPFSSEVTI